MLIYYACTWNNLAWTVAPWIPFKAVIDFIKCFISDLVWSHKLNNNLTSTFRSRIAEKDSRYFSKFYGKVGVISWLLFHLIWKNYVLYWDFDSKCWIVAFSTRFTHDKRPYNNFYRQNYSVENNYFSPTYISL